MWVKWVAGRGGRPSGRAAECPAQEAAAAAQQAPLSGLYLFLESSAFFGGFFFRGGGGGFLSCVSLYVT